MDFEPTGFRWISCDDAEQSVVAFLRRAQDPENWVLVVCNFTPAPRHDYRLGVPRYGYSQELLNTIAVAYGGSIVGNGGVWAEDVPEHEQPYSVVLTLPPLAALFLQPW